MPKREPKREEAPHNKNQLGILHHQQQQGEDILDIPTFLRNRNRRR